MHLGLTNYFMLACLFISYTTFSSLSFTFVKMIFYNFWVISVNLGRKSDAYFFRKSNQIIKFYCINQSVFISIPEVIFVCKIRLEAFRITCNLCVFILECHIISIGPSYFLGYMKYRESIAFAPKNRFPDFDESSRFEGH